MRLVVYLRICVRIMATVRWIVVSIIAVRHQEMELHILMLWVSTCDSLITH